MAYMAGSSAVQILWRASKQEKQVSKQVRSRDNLPCRQRGAQSLVLSLLDPLAST
jgi:hypothetical protein